MASESESNHRLEIGHVLFIDLVGYSKLLTEEQSERSRQLTEIVLANPQVCESTNEELVRLPTGDGMALVFRNSSEEPARCALEMARALKEHPEIQVRMGIHSGPVVQLSLGDKAEALRLLEKSYEDRAAFDTGVFGSIKIDRRLDPLRGEPRFDTLVRKVMSGDVAETP